MSFTLDEMIDSRSSTHTEPTETRRYLADGEQDDALVRGYALAGTPSAIFGPYGVLYRQDVRIDPIDFKQYAVTVPFGRRQRTTGSIAWNFDTSGATVRIRCGKEHIASYPDDGDFHKGALGVNGDGEVEGTETIIPTLKLNVTYKHPLAAVSLDYVKTLHRFTGRTNSSTFLTFAAGELLYLGAAGSDGSESEADVTYQFAASPNETDLTFGPITGVAKKGWEYAWIEFKDAVSGGQAVREPKRVHVDRVYDAVDFASIFGWS